MLNAHILLLPILLPLAGAMVTLLVGNRPRYQGSLALLVLLASLFSSLVLLTQVWTDDQTLSLQLGGWQVPFGISLVGDLLSATLVVMSQLVLTLGVIYSLGAKD